MGFLSSLFTALLENSARSTRPKRPAASYFGSESSGTTSRSSQTASRSNVTYSPGQVMSGKVDYVGPKFAKVASGDLTAVVFLGEVANNRVSAASDLLTVGQTVEFVLVKNDPRGWQASISAVPEALIRQALGGVREGALVTGCVVDLKTTGAEIDAGGFRAWVPLSELAWRWIEHPADVVFLGEKIQVQIIRIETPDGWLSNKRQRKARAIASLRACIPQPVSPTIAVAFSGLPFKVWAVAKKPRSFDAVTSFVLEELAEGKNREAIASTTGLDRATLEDIHTYLVEEKLASDWGLSRKGRDLVEALALVLDMNANPVRGVYSGAAPANSQLIAIDEHRKQQALPRGWPRPPYDKRADDSFLRAAGEALPEEILTTLVSGELREKLKKVMEDSRVRIFLRRDGESPWKTVFVDTSENWLLAGLWHVFTPFAGKPFRPASGEERCRNFLMLRCRAESSEPEGGAVETVYYEPNTQTLWILKDEQQVRINDAKGENFPDLPAELDKNIDSGTGQIVFAFQPESWCRVKVF